MAKKLFWLFLLLLIPTLASGQGSRFDSTAQKTVQNFLAPIPGATIVVCSAAGTGTPCSPTAPIYTDAGLTQQIPGSTFTADSNGNFGWWAAPGTYTYSITATGVTGRLFTIVLPINLASNNALTGSNTFSKINGVFAVDGTKYALSTAGIQSAISDAITAGGGTVDARGVGNINITSEIDIGNHAQTPVTLLLPQAATWTVSGITNGTSCALKLFSESAIIGANPSNSSMVIHAGANTNNLDSLLCTEAAPTGNGSYVRAEGFILFNPNGATLANGAANIQALFDGSEFKTITYANYGGVGLNIHGLVCCGTSFIDNVANGNGAANSIPAQITLSGSSGGFSFYGLSAGHAGAGKNEIVISGVGNGNSVRFYNTYTEGNADLTTADISAGSTAGPIEFYGVTCNDNGGSSAYCIDIPNSGTPNVHVYGLQEIVGGSANYLNDHFTGKTFACSSGNLPMYLSNGLIFSRFQTSGPAPASCTFLTGRGTSPSCSLSSGSTDSLGTVILTTGTGAPGSSGTFKATFSSSFATAIGSRCVYTLNNGGGAWNARATIMVGDTGTVTWDNNAVALTASTGYFVNYLCGAN